MGGEEPAGHCTSHRGCHGHPGLGSPVPSGRGVSGRPFPVGPSAPHTVYLEFSLHRRPLFYLEAKAGCTARPPRVPTCGPRPLQWSAQVDREAGVAAQTMALCRPLRPRAGWRSSWGSCGSHKTGLTRRRTLTAVPTVAAHMGWVSLCAKLRVWSTRPTELLLWGNVLPLGADTTV